MAAPLSRRDQFRTRTGTHEFTPIRAYRLRTRLIAAAHVLHIEVDRRLSGTQGERLRDIRLVVRRPADARDIPVVPAAVHIIAFCLPALVFPGANQGEVRAFMRERLNLVWDSSTQPNAQI